MRTQIDLAVDMAELDRLTDAIERFCEANDIPPVPSTHLTLVLEELFTNMVGHGYPGAHPDGQPIRIVLAAEEGRVRVHVSDTGIPFDPLSVPTPDTSLGVDERAIGGLGVHFMRRMMTDLRYSRQDGRNILDFSKIWTV
jgi:serine/threonine-protein kinase RsbW